MTDLYICGAGNPEGVRLARAINRLERRWERILLLDDDPAKHGQTLLGVEIAGPFDVLADLPEGSAEVLTYVARDMPLRWRVRRRLAEFGQPFARLIHPGVDVEDVALGADLIVYENVSLSPLAAIGDGGMVCMSAVIAHECEIGRCCFISPGAALNSRVIVGDGVFIGANATVIPETRIGAWATVGAGAVVTRDVPPGATVVGAPARVIAQNPAPPESVTGWRPED